MKYKKLMKECNGNEALVCELCKYQKECQEFVKTFEMRPVTLRFILNTKIEIKE